jgi:hypothetical protein
MVILVHVLLAIGSLFLASYSYISPSTARIRNSYILISSTLLSGTYLIFANQVNILRTCLTGLTFLAVTTYVTHQARVKYASKLQAELVITDTK